MVFSALHFPTTKHPACAVIGVAALLGACTSGPRVDVVTSGALPSAGAYSLVDTADTASRRTLSVCLAAHGLTPANGAAYLALLSESDRPRPVGAMTPQAESDKRPDIWLPGAAPDRRQVRSLTLVLMQAATGQELYRIVVRQRYRAGRKVALADLAASACANLTAPPGKKR